ncbi:MAG: hypothetical protein JOZ07_13320 [Solirubrobacterales bacterium]|nr:hypothetical protein [Solirubrobacterales bacterium]
MSELRRTVERVTPHTFVVPTDGAESDGTFHWEATTVIVVEVGCDGHWGLGYTYGPRAVASVIGHELRDVVCGSDPLTPQRTWEAMHAALRNAGQSGIGAMAIAALDIALHDLRARLLDVPLAVALGAVRDAVPIYGSGGFTSYPVQRIAEQLAGWVAQGIPRVKIKVGRHPGQDPERLTAARDAIGPDVELMVDANGAFSPETAVAWARRYADFDARWLEEPVTQDDPAGLRRVREQAPPELAIASGEYSWSRYATARLLQAEAVDVVQADVTRCCGATELARIDALCAAANRPLSLHCAPAISAHAGCALTQLRHLEYFHDHLRIEDMLFDGTLSPVDGALAPDLTVPGHGLELKRADAQRYAVS